MKKGLSFVEIIAFFSIIIIIGFIVFIMVFGVIKNMEKDKDKIILDNYANNVIYINELFMRNNDNNIPKYCISNKNKTFYDVNNNFVYDSNELECNKDCDNDNCIKYFITKDDINSKSITCNKIIIDVDGNIEIGNCFIKEKEVKNYSFSTKNSVE